MRPLVLFTLLLTTVAPASAAQPAQTTPERDDAAYQFLLARHLESIGRVEEAIKAYERAIALDSGRPSPRRARRTLRPTGQCPRGGREC